jgi:hypothetical protein
MVDTITLRIHNIKTYKGLYEQYLIVSKKKNTVTQGHIVVDEDGVVTEKSRLWQRVTAFGDTGNFLPDRHCFDIYTPSSNYVLRGCLGTWIVTKLFWK